MQQPHPPVWIGGWGDITLRRAATLADNWIPGPTADLKRLLAGQQQFLERRIAAGRPAPTEWPLTRDVIIADTDKRARELAEEHIMVAYRREYAGGWRHPFIDASIATDLDRLMEDRFIIGGPEQCIAETPPVRRGVRHDPPHLPDLLSRDAARAHHARDRAHSHARLCQPFGRASAVETKSGAPDLTR